MSFLSRKLAFLCLILLFPLKALAWNALGHMVVADIAYLNLKPEVREKANKLVSYLHHEYPKTNSFVDISTWPDLIRWQKIEMFTHWHYIDVPFTDGTAPIVDTIDSDNGVWALNTMQRIVKNENANEYERGRFLAFLVHIVGDLHQPLHTVSRITSKTPKGDAGGNKVYVHYKGKRVNLHTIWDEGAGAFTGEASPENAELLAKSIAARYPQQHFAARAKDLDANTWTKEGMENAKKYVYSTQEDAEVTTAYIENGRQLAEQEAALAGYRLAEMLNTLLA
jgi:hypothetical protein